MLLYNRDEKLEMFNWTGQKTKKTNKTWKKKKRKKNSNMNWYLPSFSALRTIAILLYPCFHCHCQPTYLRQTQKNTSTYNKNPRKICTIAEFSHLVLDTL